MELYDLENDWPEKHNVASDFPEVTKRLSKKLAARQCSLPTSPSENELSKDRKKFSK